MADLADYLPPTEGPPTEGPPRHPRWGLTRAQVLGVVLAALLIASLLGAEGLHATADAQSFGWRRDVGVMIARPLLRTSRVLGFDEPADVVDEIGATPAPIAVERVLATPVPTPTPAPTPQPPLRLQPGARALGFPELERIGSLYAAGDSVSGLLGGTLRSFAAGYGAEAEAEFRLSTGLARPDTFDWPARIAERTRELDPEIVVVMFGANDVNHMRQDGRAIRFGTPEWHDEYVRRVGALMDELSGRRVYWVGQPIMRDGELAASVAGMNAIFEQQAQGRRHVTYVDAWSTFSSAEGTYTPFLPGTGGELVKVRADDGIHLSHAGGDRLAAVILHDLAERPTTGSDPPG